LLFVDVEVNEGIEHVNDKEGEEGVKDNKGTEGAFLYKVSHSLH
jgi:hypothetical protein